MIGEVVRPGELGETELATWRAIQQSDETLDNPFLSPEFASVVGSARPNARVAVLVDGDRRAFLPFERHRLGFARAIGAGMSDCQGLVVENGFRLDGQELLRACDLRLWRFDHLVAHQAEVLVPGTGRVPSPVIDLDHGFDAYLAGRREASKSLVSTAERKARKLGREVGELRWVVDEPDHALVDRLIGWKREQYRRTQVRDVLADPATSAIVHRLLDARTTTFSGLLSVLYAGDRPVAAHLGVRTPTVLSWWIPAYDHEYAHYSPGITMLLRLAAWAAAGGIRRIDLGRGAASYKDRFASGQTHVADGVLARPHARRPFEALRAARHHTRRPPPAPVTDEAT